MCEPAKLKIQIQITSKTDKMRCAPSPETFTHGMRAGDHSRGDQVLARGAPESTLSPKSKLKQEQKQESSNLS